MFVFGFVRIRKQSFNRRSEESRRHTVYVEDSITQIKRKDEVEGRRGEESLVLQLKDTDAEREGRGFLHKVAKEGCVAARN